jgi:hypothetical protein
VDRSAAYAARHIAKNLVAAGIAKRLEVQLAYAIGVAQPVSVPWTLWNRQVPMRKFLRLFTSISTFALGHHRPVGASPPHLPADRRLWSLRAR